MPSLDITRFEGETPFIPARRLSQSNATHARNCLLNDGDLTPLKAPLMLNKQPSLVVNPTSLYLYNTNWFSWTQNVSAVASPILEDPYDRVYFTGKGKPQVTYNTIATGAGINPVASYDLGIPAPTLAPVGVVNVGDENDPDPDGAADDETRYYVYTYVSAAGEEGAPSPLSNKLTIKTPDVDSVTLTVYPPDLNLANITRLRIYRTASTIDTTQFYFVAELPVENVDFQETLLESELGTVLETEDYLPPPENMQGLVALSGGALAGVADSTLSISESFLPYAWPKVYQQKSQWPIKGIVPFTGGAVVTTEGEPYLLTGTMPASMMFESLGAQQSCVSERSMVAMDGFVVYASPDGIIIVDGSGANLISDSLISAQQWQALKPHTIHAYYHEGEYIAFYGDEHGTGNGVGGFILNPSRKDLRFFDYYATAGYRDLKADAFYIVMNGYLYEWGKGESLTAIWRSKVFDTPAINFSLAQVKAPDFSDVIVRIYCDDVLTFTHQLTDEHNGTFWLPDGLYTRWQVEVETTKPVSSISLATSRNELS